jgi:hypothetical protein
VPSAYDEVFFFGRNNRSVRFVIPFENHMMSLVLTSSLGEIPWVDGSWSKIIGGL